MKNGGLPWFEHGDFFVDVTDEKNPKYYRVRTGPEPLPSFTYTFPATAPNRESDWTRMDSTTTDLETDKYDLFFQYFFGVQRDGLVYMQYPLGEQFWTTDKLVPTDAKPNVACVTLDTSPYLDPAADTEFFIIKGTSVGFKFRNTASYTQNNEIRFVGRKFRIEEVQPTPEIVAKARAIRFARIA